MSTLTLHTAEEEEDIVLSLAGSGSLGVDRRWEDIEVIATALVELRDELRGEIDRARRHAARWKALARRLFRERVPIAGVCHETGNALVPALTILERIPRGDVEGQDVSSLARNAAMGVRRVLDFARGLRQGDPGARVWRRS